MIDDGATTPLRISPDTHGAAGAVPAAVPPSPTTPTPTTPALTTEAADAAGSAATSPASASAPASTPAPALGVDQETDRIRRVPRPRPPAGSNDVERDGLGPHDNLSHDDRPHDSPPPGDSPDQDRAGQDRPRQLEDDQAQVDQGRSDDAGVAAPRRGWLNRVVVAVAALCSTAVLATVMVGYVFVQFYDQQVERESIELPDVEVTRPPPPVMGAETWLLVGSDVRSGSDAAEVGGARSDTMMIVHLASDGTTTGVSVPRDLRVPVPAWTDDDGKRHPARTDKINAAFAVGGPGLLVATLEQVSGTRVDHYAEIDFAGFQQMSTALGGVEVCLTSSPFVERFALGNGRTVRATNLDDPSSGFRGEEGTNVLSGEQALAFVRQRHGFTDGDLSRIRRQQAFLGAVFRQVTSSDVLLDPISLNRFLGSVTDALVLDDDTSVFDLRSLATRLRDATTGDVTFTTVPISGQVARPVFYFTYDPWTVRSMFADIVGSDVQAVPTTEPAPTAAGPAVTPRTTGADRTGGSASPPPNAQIEVTVLNGTSTRGLATKVAGRLRDAGFTVSRVADAADGHHATTEVRYEQGDPAAAAGARQLITAVPGATAVPDSSLDEGEFTLVLGTDLADVLSEPVPTTPTSKDVAPSPYYTQEPVTAASGCIL